VALKEWEISWGPKPLRNLPIWSVPTKFADAGIRQSWSAARSGAWVSSRPGDQRPATGGQTAGDEPARGQCGHPAKRRRPATRSQRGCGQGQGSPARCGRHQRPNELQSPLTVRQNASRGKCQGSGAAGGWQQRRH